MILLNLRTGYTSCIEKTCSNFENFARMKVLNPMKFSKSTHKLFFCLFVLIVLSVCIPQAAFCQTQKLGVVQYTPPKEWNKTAKENIVAFSKLNETTGGFCIITVYGATPSVGNPESDFKKEWNNLVVKPLEAEANPKTETESANGWTMIAGGQAWNSREPSLLLF